MCSKAEESEKNAISPTETKGRKGDDNNQIFAKGADISWLPQMEATGYKFYNDNAMSFS